jgi:hypothetical protein
MNVRLTAGVKVLNSRMEAAGRSCSYGDQRGWLEGNCCLCSGGVKTKKNVRWVNPAGLGRVGGGLRAVYSASCGDRNSGKSTPYI